MRMRILCTVVCCWLCVSVGMADTFDWRRANVYFVMTDRAIPVAPFFCDGDTLTECYSGRQTTVQHGVVRLTRYENGVAVFVRRK